MKLRFKPYISKETKDEFERIYKLINSECFGGGDGYGVNFYLTECPSYFGGYIKLVKAPNIQRRNEGNSFTIKIIA